MLVAQPSRGSSARLDKLLLHQLLIFDMEVQSDRALVASVNPLAALIPDDTADNPATVLARVARSRY